MFDPQAAKARCEAATPEPWHQSQHSIERDYVFNPNNDPVAVATTRRGNVGAVQRNERNAEFIAHARSDLPAALEALEEAQGFVEELGTTGKCDQCGERIDGKEGSDWGIYCACRHGRPCRHRYRTGQGCIICEFLGESE